MLPIPLFVAFEGIDASGKETQSKLYYRWLDELTPVHKPRPKYYSFPRYETRIGRLIDRHLHHQWQTVGTTLVEEHQVFQCLNLADKVEAGVDIRDHLQRGQSVVADRFNKSAEVYGVIDGLDIEWLRNTQRILPKPHIQFLIHITLEESLKRRPRDQQSDRYERDVTNMRRRADLYFNLWSDSTDSSLIIIDGMRSIEEVHRECVVATELYLHKVGAL